MSSSRSPYSPVRSNTKTLYDQFRSESSQAPRSYPSPRSPRSSSGCSTCVRTEREIERERSNVDELEAETRSLINELDELEYLRERSRQKSPVRSRSPPRSKEPSLEEDLRELADLEERARRKSLSGRSSSAARSSGDMYKTPPPVVRMPRSMPSSPPASRTVPRRTPTANSKVARVLFPEENDGEDLRSTRVLSSRTGRSPTRGPPSPKPSPTRLPNHITGVVVNESHNPVTGDFGVIREHEGVKHYFLNDQPVSRSTYLNALV